MAAIKPPARYVVKVFEIFNGQPALIQQQDCHKLKDSETLAKNWSKKHCTERHPTIAMTVVDVLDTKEKAGEQLVLRIRAWADGKTKTQLVGKDG